MTPNEMESALQNLLLKHGVQNDSGTPYYQQLESIQLVELIIDLESLFRIEITALDYKPESFVNNSSILTLVQRLRSESTGRNSP